MFDFFLFTHIYITKKQKIFTFLDSDKVKKNLTPTHVIFEIYNLLLIKTLMFQYILRTHSSIDKLRLPNH